MEQAKSFLCLLCLFICLNITKISACVDGPTPKVPITFHKTDNGAVCLDGSPAAYYHDQGEGEGSSNWLIFFEGGGWCSNTTECYGRSKNNLGSSSQLNRSMEFGHILSKNSKGNPDFCSWNRVHVHYCDGSSYTGDVETVNSTTNVTYRGARIFSGIMEDLLERGMKNAKNAILSGSSAGGLAVILHCDRFRSLLPSIARVKCLSDSAYFLHDKYLIGNKRFDTVFQGLIDLQGSGPMLPSSCTAKLIKPSLCFFPQYTLQSVRTPLFIVMSSFDQVQNSYNLSPEHDTCLVYKNCTLHQMIAIQGLRLKLLHALPVSSPSFRGMWITSCITHEITLYSWIAPKLMTIAGNKTYPQVFADWFYDRSAAQIIDSSSEAKNCTAFGLHIKK